jgi:hypothetical protein
MTSAKTLFPSTGHIHRPGVGEGAKTLMYLLGHQSTHNTVGQSKAAGPSSQQDLGCGFPQPWTKSSTMVVFSRVLRLTSVGYVDPN